MNIKRVVAAEAKYRALAALEMADEDRSYDSVGSDAPSEPDYESMSDVSNYLSEGSQEYYQDRQQDRYDRQFYGD